MSAAIGHMNQSGESPEVKLAYVVLAHEVGEQVIAQIEMLLEADPTGHVIVHYDLNASDRDFALIRDAVFHHDRAYLVQDRAKCGWGMFGLVDGVVRALRVIRDRGIDCTHVYLLSSSCVPIKPIATLKRFLHEHDGMEFIEANTSDWIVGGLREERYLYFHWFSYRTHPRLFDFSWKLQRALPFRRRPPKGLQLRFGSQWWCLTKKTCLAILSFIDRNPRGYRFFSRTWIPDELFFQTMAANIAGAERIFGKGLTFFKFSWKGRPITFYDDHLDVMESLPLFFARKVSPGARTLRRRMREVASAPDDGGALPSLEASPRQFDYAERVARNVEFTRPGQMFYADQIFHRWPASLAAHRGVFAVLHGPPPITRMVRERLSAVPGITVLGRVFRQNAVELAQRDDSFAGLGEGDAKIRDLDRPLYLSRLLGRSSGMPVLEVAPGDDNDGEWHFHRDKNVIFIACVPALAAEEDWNRIYWMLAATDILARKETRYVPRDGDNLGRVRDRIDSYLAGVCAPSHRQWVNDSILGPHASERLLPLPWGGGERQRRRHRKLVAQRLRRVHLTFGPLAEPLVQAITEAHAALASVPTSEMLSALPNDWVQLITHVSTLEERSQRRHAPVPHPAEQVERGIALMKGRKLG